MPQSNDPLVLKPVTPSPKSQRAIPAVCFVAALVSLAVALGPFLIDYIDTAIVFYNAAAAAACATIVAAAIGTICLWRKRCSRLAFVWTTAALFVSAYVLVYAATAIFWEYPRAKIHAEAVHQLQMLHGAVLEFTEKSDAYPTQMNSLPKYKGLNRTWQIPASEEALQLWPEGAPEGNAITPLPQNVVVAAVVSPGFRSHWFSAAFLYPSFLRPTPLPNQSISYDDQPPSIAEMLEREDEEQSMKDRLWGRLFGTKIRGELRINGAGVVAWDSGHVEMNVDTLLDRFGPAGHYIEFYDDGSVKDLRVDAATDAGLAHLRGLLHLQRLSLWQSNATNIGLSHIAEMHDLTELDIQWADISDEGLLKLSGLSRLRRLNLDGCEAVTDAGVASLKRKLPNCEIAR